MTRGPSRSQADTFLAIWYRKFYTDGLRLAYKQLEVMNGGANSEHYADTFAHWYAARKMEAK
jgi:hypothetical protein